MVTPEDDDRVLFQTESPESIKQASDLGIRIADAGVVTAAEMTRLVGAELLVFRYVLVAAQLAVLMKMPLERTNTPDPSAPCSS